MISLIIAATLNIGVYYTFPAESILLHNREGRGTISRSKIDIQKAISDLLDRAEKVINKEIFGGRHAVKLKLVFTKRWTLAKPPIYQDINIPHAVDIKKIWPMVDSLNHLPADLYLILFATDLIYIYEKIDDKILVDGVVDTDHHNKVALANFTNLPIQVNSTTLLLHELGHIFRLGHNEGAACKAINFMMCPFAHYNGPPMLDEPYKQAWRDFYYQKTGKRFEPR